MSFWWCESSAPLSDAAGVLLEDVAAVFGNLSAGHSDCQDPHRGDLPGDEEYERCLEPGRFETAVSPWAADWQPHWSTGGNS